jgi:hypothetical protein
LEKGWAIFTSFSASRMAGVLSLIIFALTRDDKPPADLTYFCAAWLAVAGLPVAVTWSLRDKVEFATYVWNWPRRALTRRPWNQFD